MSKWWGVLILHPWWGVQIGGKLQIKVKWFALIKIPDPTVGNFAKVNVMAKGDFWLNILVNVLA